MSGYKQFDVCCITPSKGSIESSRFDASEWTEVDAVEQFCTDHQLSVSEVRIEPVDENGELIIELFHTGDSLYEDDCIPLGPMDINSPSVSCYDAVFNRLDGKPSMFDRPASVETAPQEQPAAVEFGKVTTWTLFDADGYIQKNGVDVQHYEDGTTRINASLHATDELTISANRIESHNAGWYLTR